MKIIFVMRYTHHFHYFKSIVRALYERGHDATVFFTRNTRNPRNEDIFLEGVESSRGDIPKLEYDFIKNTEGSWNELASLIHVILSYRRYLRVNNQSDYYRDRMTIYIPWYLKPFITWRVFWPLVRSDFFGRVLKFLESRIPYAPSVLEEIKKFNPEAIIVAPPNMSGTSVDSEYIRVAKHLKIPVAVPVISWDYLGTKGFIATQPDLLLVWNETQVKDAIEHHEIAIENIKIIGAPVFDNWFSHLKSSVSKEEFCRRHGLNSDFPIVTYLGSSRNMAKDESWILDLMIKSLAGHVDPRIRNTQIIVRPHPHNYKIYQRLKQEFKPVFILPESGTLPNTESNLQFFYDTLSVSEVAIQGVNTSGVIDAMIAGVPTVTFLTDEYKTTQVDTTHFQQLLENKTTPFLKDPEEFAPVLLDLLNGKDEYKEKRQEFIRKFIRPRGLEISAGEWGVREVEKLVELPITNNQLR